MPPAMPKDVFAWEGKLLGPQQSLCRKTLETVLAELGPAGMSSWAYRFINADWTQQGQLVFKGVDKQRFDDTKVALKEELLRLEHENKEFLKTFEDRAMQITRELLDKGEQEIKKEQDRLGLKPGHRQTAAEAKAFTDMQAAARELAPKRRNADKLYKEWGQAQKKFGAAMLPTGTEPANLVSLPAAQEELDSARKKFSEAEEAFAKDAQAATAKHPALAAFLSGGNVASMLDRVGASASAATYFSMKHFEEKLENIAKVRSELGGRFNVWKQPALLATTKQQMNATPGQGHVVNDKAKSVAADDASSKMMWAAIALGLGLLAAIPTGGSSLLIGAAAAATIVGAGVAVYRAYEETQEYLLSKATANVALDRAQAINKDDPSFMWLAIEVAGALVDVVAAGAAFKALKGAILTAKSQGAIRGIETVAGAVRQAGMTPSGQGRVLAHVLLEQGGDIGQALNDLRQVFIRTAAAHKQDKLTQVMAKVATKVLDEGRVGVIPGRGALVDMLPIRDKLKHFGLKGAELERRTKQIWNDFANPQLAGMHYPDLGLIFLKGDRSAGNVATWLVHEMTHRQQKIMGMLETSTLYEQEFQAFKAQQRFLEMLPGELQPNDMKWLLTATNADIETHVLTAYSKGGAFKPHGFSNDDVADAVTEIMIHGAK